MTDQVICPNKHCTWEGLVTQASASAVWAEDAAQWVQPLRCPVCGVKLSGDTGATHAVCRNEECAWEGPAIKCLNYWAHLPLRCPLCCDPVVLED